MLLQALTQQLAWLEDVQGKMGALLEVLSDPPLAACGQCKIADHAFCTLSEASGEGQGAGDPRESMVVQEASDGAATGGSASTGGRA